MRFSAIFILGVLLVKYFDTAECYDDEGRGHEDLALTGEARRTQNADIENVLTVLERRDNTGSGRNSTKRNKNRRPKKDPMRPKGLNVTRVNSGDIVTNASFGNNVTTYVRSYVGNWTEHAQCLMPCNPRRDDPCKNLAGGNCTCVARNDHFGRDVGVCALMNATLGNYVEYGGTSAWLPKGVR
uniref:Putative secreted protein n=1 Tax=Amblyomma cajennense TaxID=34607 RepID=A0A023FEA4_AMBCJ